VKTRQQETIVETGTVKTIGLEVIDTDHPVMTVPMTEGTIKDHNHLTEIEIDHSLMIEIGTEIQITDNSQTIETGTEIRTTDLGVNLTTGHHTQTMEIDTIEVTHVTDTNQTDTTMVTITNNLLLIIIHNTNHSTINNKINHPTHHFVRYAMKTIDMDVT
jgi:hypothetical protein